jgi:hypothetical protein
MEADVLEAHLIESIAVLHKFRTLFYWLMIERQSFFFHYWLYLCLLLQRVTSVNTDSLECTEEKGTDFTATKWV